MLIPEGDIRYACIEHGAKAVLKAAHALMAGDSRALVAVGLPEVTDFNDGDRIGQVAYSAMTPTEREALFAESAVLLGLRPG